MNIIVTGGAGFIGSHLCKRLVEDGHYVICIDNLSLGSIKNIHHLINHKQFLFQEGDILDKTFMNNICEQNAIDSIYHLAANSDIQAGSNHLEIDVTKTFQTTVNCLECIRTYSIKSFIFASSSAVYGDFCEPMREEAGPCRPISFYGAAKLASEHYIHAMLEQVDCKAWVIRFPNVVGPHLTHGVIYDFIRKLQKNPDKLEILGDGKQCKPYMLVDDLIEGMLRAEDTLKDTFNVINLGVETATTVTEIANKIVKYMNLTDVLFSYTGGSTGWVGDVPTFQYDLTKMKALGWSPSVTSDEAIQRCIEAEIQ
ncbi:epimerase [Candidatus Marinamargulisbacteria bacterium SCGC AG-333-B06]|nr:epimerase [Candidatus Marinamargulisbacteria bacterium SCGC AG-333-B06]